MAEKKAKAKTPKSTMKAITEWQKNNVKQVKFNFHKTIDADIIEWLDSKENKLGYIKELIRADIAKEKTEE